MIDLGVIHVLKCLSEHDFRICSLCSHICDFIGVAIVGTSGWTVGNEGASGRELSRGGRG